MLAAALETTPGHLLRDRSQTSIRDLERHQSLIDRVADAIEECEAVGLDRADVFERLEFHGKLQSMFRSDTTPTDALLAFNRSMARIRDQAAQAKKIDDMTTAAGRTSKRRGRDEGNR